MTEQPQAPVNSASPAPAADIEVTLKDDLKSFLRQFSGREVEVHLIAEMCSDEGHPDGGKLVTAGNDFIAIFSDEEPGSLFVYPIQNVTRVYIPSERVMADLFGKTSIP
jgi:hypothetical protein